MEMTAFVFAFTTLYCFCLSLLPEPLVVNIQLSNLCSMNVSSTSVYEILLKQTTFDPYV